jgi:hypothetical protein
MPYYNFINRDTGEEWSEMMTIAEAEQLEKDNPNIERLPAAPFIGDPWRQGLKKPDQDFRDRLKHIKKTHGGNFETW